MTRQISRLVLILFLIVLFGQFSSAEELDYRVGEGDVLKVMVYDNPDLETTTRVSGKGVILFPLVGEIAIDGLSISEVAQKIASKLAQGYILDPQVSVFVETFGSQKATIMGEVVVPGLYELSGATTLMEMISKAGGLTDEAGDVVTIRRKNPANPDQDDTITVNLKNLMERNGTNAKLTIRGGDSIFVSKAGVFYVTGQVNKPDAYKFEAGTSVIKAVTMAGGFTELASQKRIQIIRQVNGSERVLEKVPLHTPVKPDDVIMVPESFF
ncbi:periplasmic polysaccharide biosynthesis/export protein [Syntrophotalea carbinolica DSM 2380]|uniref:Periplasmic polysaccharide biosynthesis/export protein n=1 Tax=Syntrophotalea carbinolica (strain DSM 2380 / NBRC 103641 / GraBd1) TaxID=338963 RepID=Q3A4C4_SYNC1|nr:SLBB domain-containing protein [Syntrophotalea carbinolica]ABA88783.1 periplasmic polysaccharide biosynthesis/export protein [Syntrophotalea carbinolica DSM 2380]